MNTTKNEYRPLADRKAPADMSLPELVREFAGLKVWFAVRGTGTVSHLNRLFEVVGELRSRNALD